MIFLKVVFTKSVWDSNYFILWFEYKNFIVIDWVLKISNEMAQNDFKSLISKVCFKICFVAQKFV